MAELGALNPRYWYIDDKGKICKYHYCRLCHAGPFKESENKEKFNFFGMGNKDPYCMACSSAHKHFQTEFVPRKNKNPLSEALSQEQIPSPFIEETPIDIPELS
jgi:hypothetical protein